MRFFFSAFPDAYGIIHYTHMSRETIAPEVVSKPFWSLSTEETLATLRTSSSGLSESEAETRRKIFGPNSVAQKERRSWPAILFRQLENPLIIILNIAGAITIVLRDWIEMGAIFAAVIVNAALGFWQEYKAEEALERLTSFIRTRARVRRNGNEREVNAYELVPGDIIRITQGDRVPADCRILFARDLEIDESVLTGESLPVPKTSDALPPATRLPERASMAFSGTLVFKGFADAVVTSTGPATEFGKIASLVAAEGREPTPLQRAITRFTVAAGAVIGAMTIVLFGMGLARGYDLYEMFLIAVAVAVSAVPEGLPVALTVILAIGVERIAKKNGVVRKLLAAETLGSTTLILTDKTGTLTQAQMQLTDTIPYAEDSAETETELLHDALMNTDVVIENPSDPPAEWRMSGRPLEIALVRAAAERGILYPYLMAERKIVDRYPFNPETKFSAAIYRKGPTLHLTILGAPESVLRYSRLPQEERILVEEEVNARAYAGARVLGVVSGTLAHGGMSWDEFIEKPRAVFEFRGLLALSDPLRPETKGAVERIRKAGVHTIILTGDHKGTAESIARELGLIDGKAAVLTGEDLEHLSPEELASRAGEIAVYARVSPAQKLMLTKLYKSRGEIVAVTGDGVNDAPALRAADIGVAVGSGTDVAKSAADLVLLDDNFNTLVTAVEEGRRIIENIRKVMVYLLSNAFAELLLIGGALLTGLALPLNAIQILFVNFFSDSFPAVALAFEEGIDDGGSRPKKLSRSLIDREVGFLIFGIGVFTSLCLFLLYRALTQLGYPAALVKTFIFSAFATYTLFLSFSVRSLRKSIVAYNPFSNRYLLLGVAIGLLLTLSVIYIPAAHAVFDTIPLPLPWVVASAGIGIFNIGLVEISKWLFRLRIL